MIEIERPAIVMHEYDCASDELSGDLDMALEYYWAWPVDQQPGTMLIHHCQQAWFRISDYPPEAPSDTTHVAITTASGERRVYRLTDTWHPSEHARLGIWVD